MSLGGKIFCIQCQYGEGASAALTVTHFPLRKRRMMTIQPRKRVMTDKGSAKPIQLAKVMPDPCWSRFKVLYRALKKLPLTDRRQIKAIARACTSRFSSVPRVVIADH